MTSGAHNRGSTIGIGGAVDGRNDRLIDFFAALHPVEVDYTVDREDLSWQDDGLCAETDPDAFFPDKGGSTREAKQVCAACGIRAKCLEYALEHDERFGVWGGKSERERRRIAKERAEAQVPVKAETTELCPAGEHRMTKGNTCVSLSTGEPQCRKCRNAARIANTPAETTKGFGSNKEVQSGSGSRKAA